MWQEEQIKKYIKEQLNEPRFIHSIGVMETSEKLAIFYGADPYKARIAGLCHDCAKNLTRGELIHMAEEKEGKLPEIYLHAPQLLHGLVGSYISKNIFEIYDEDILNSIRYHTTGRKDMSLLEKIIYISDYIEPSRNFRGVNELRKLTYIDLDKVLLKSFDDTINYTVSRGSLLHIDTIEARNYLLYKN
ncbi:bis(5'-nucleosyl)-tetraphosphatase (symmetrical) YqeK [Clostridium sp.]|uniref:bis(5'-nucleosyl)-tetraphosphatase (symmetrical) YqeK n=1 Tax=Clostridium sp. TaxID=1506 RepID=UPI002FC610E0